MRSTWVNERADGQRRPPHWRWSAPRFAFAVLALIALTTTTAGAAEWVATKVQGTVIRLVDERWLELSIGEAVSNGQAVRTMQSGRAELDLDGLHVSLTRNTVMMMTGDTRSGGAQLHQYTGQVAVTASSGTRYTITTPDLVVAGKGSTIVSVDNGLSRVQVVEGEAQILDRSGQRIALHAGDEGTSDGGRLAVLDRGGAVTATAAEASAAETGVASAEPPTGAGSLPTGGSAEGQGAGTAATGSAANGEGGSQSGVSNGGTGAGNGNSENAGGSKGGSAGNSGNSDNTGGNGNANGNNGIGGGNRGPTGNNTGESNGKSSEAPGKGNGADK